MILSLFTAALLLVPSANAFFRLPCAKPVVDARIDPIINPGRASSHLHTIMGSSAIGYGTTFGDLRNSQCSTCKVKDDKSAYWIPSYIISTRNGSFQAVTHGGMIVYYIQRNAPNETVQAFPDGLRIFTGNPYARSNTGTPESKAISWNCLNFNAPPGRRPQDSPTPIAQTVSGPKYHKSHMAYPDRIDNGLCPSSHPIHLVSIFYEVYYNVAPFNALNNGGRFVLANGDPTGYGLHGDFLNGWDRNCPVFQNEGRFYADADMNLCSATNPLPNESVPYAVPYLPGCVAVTDGPGAASPGTLAPGCAAPAARRSDPEVVERAPAAGPETNVHRRTGTAPCVGKGRTC
ncbi:hypothetical protein BJV78DRAFT_1158123 [Lactifluus subvellereus]|nr:hypothetical protein BJV78DRAFT_1158123 [Lactifluus subvellereus]